MHLFAPVKTDDFPELDGIVLFELFDSEGLPLYLEIRYSSFDDKEVDGDHLFFESIDVVKRETEETYSIAPETWRTLTNDEAQLIDKQIQ